MEINTSELAATRALLEKERQLSRDITSAWLNQIAVNTTLQTKYDKARKTIVLICIIALSIGFSMLFI